MKLCMARLYYYYHRLLRRTLVRSVILLSILASFLFPSQVHTQGYSIGFFAADNPFIQYTGRIDFTDPKLPRFWQPGVYITAKFKGHRCKIILNDEVLWGKNHNYLEVILDGKVKRFQTKAKRDTIDIYKNLLEGEHTFVICKNTEANIGYLEFVGIWCHELVKPSDRKSVV